jgi:HD superfamily phosphohydrolase
MKFIQCPLYGEIEVSDLAITLIDTPVFQRLHNIRQTGTCFQVFPSATHSRFSHSLGTYMLAKRLATRLSAQEGGVLDALQGQSIEHIAIAGLLHDIGHGPYSHIFEKVVRSKLDVTWTHERQSIRLFRYMIQTYNIPLNPIAMTFIEHCIDPPADKVNRWMYQLVCNKWNGVDVDKIDYIRRDMFFMGISSNLPTDRILSHATIHTGQLAFPRRVSGDLLELFYQRFRMYRYIYQHSVVLACDQIIERIMLGVPDLRVFLQSSEQFLLLNDQTLVYLSRDAEAKKLFSTRSVSSIDIQSVPRSAGIVGSVQCKSLLMERVLFSDGSTMADVSGPQGTFIRSLHEENWA